MRAFLAWFCAEYPRHCGGTVYQLHPGDHNAARALLETRTVERVQAMAVCLWTDPDPRDEWLQRTDRSVRVLRHRAMQLERRVVQRGSPAVRTARSRRESGETRRMRVIACLQEHVDGQHLEGALVAPCAEAIRMLQSGNDDIARIEDTLLEAATDVVDLAACQAEAEAELRQFSRLTPDHYQRSFAAAVARGIRRRAKLPDFSELM